MATSARVDVAVPAFRGLDVAWLLDDWAQRQPNETFIVWAPFDGDPERLTFAELRSEARRFAAGLHDRGLGQGDFVLIHLDNCPQFLVAWFACIYLGVVPVTLNTRSVLDNVAYDADVIKPRGAITEPTYAELVRTACGELDVMVVTHPGPGEEDEGPALEDIGALAFDAVLADASSLPALPRDPQRNLAIQFTSGTTSRPKATLWTHANGLWGGRSMAMNLRLRSDDVTLIYMPLFHANAQITLLSTLWTGGTAVIHPKFSASRFWDTCVRHGVTWVSMIPFAFKALRGRPVPDHKVRVLMGLSRLPDAEAEFKVQTLALWGMTETLSSCIVTDADHPGPAGTIGRPSPFYQVEVRKKDGTPAGTGEEGLLFIRGQRGVSLFKEYFRNADATRDAFDDTGALDTGDIVRIDDDGWMFYVSRDKDMLRVGGENVAALEIETAIEETGLVSECAVVAQKHDMLGDVPVAFVSRSDAATGMSDEALGERIIRHCTQVLADFKVPRSVFVVDAFPRSSLDRIAKKELRNRLPEIREG